MQKIVLMASLSSIVLLSGCATITNGRYQQVTVATQPQGASCVLKNNKGTWNVKSTPETIEVHRSMDDLHVACKKPGYKDTPSTVKSTTKKMIAGNILFGGIVGGGVDAYNGSGFSYPTQINLNLDSGKGEV